MCGIAGMVANAPGHPALDRIPSIARMLEHRGPDDTGFLVGSPISMARARRWEPHADTTVALLHRRLSIIDLSDAASQPMLTLDGRIALIFNGEVYNYVELRSELESLGRVFHSSSDTEVVLQAYLQWGTDAFERFTGMFALAIVDLPRRSIVLARDPFGIKPLYYATGKGLFFASEVPALLELAQPGRRADARTLYRYLRYGVTDGGGATLLAEVRQIPAASYACISLDRPDIVETKAYWRPQIRTNRDITFAEAALALRERFLRSVELHLRSDVPLGAALSGGIDSSSIVAAIRAISPTAEIHAFSYVARGTEFDEERWIDMAAAAAGASVHKVFPNAGEMQSELAALTAVQGEPFGSTSIYAQYRVFAEAAKHGIKVMLDGQGADEIFGGYRQYLGARLASLLRSGRIGEARAFIQRASTQPGAPASYLLQKAAEYLLPAGAQTVLRKAVGRETMPAWLNAAWFHNAGVNGAPLVATANREILKEALVSDLFDSSLPSLLRYEDRNSMASSIESRVPFLTTGIVDFVLDLPEEYLIGGDGLTKRVFREAMRGLVSEPILARRDKIGFATPEREWLQSLDAWVRPMLEGQTGDEIPALNGASLAPLWDDTLNGLRRFDYHLWRVFNLIYWSRQFGVTYG